MTKHKKLTFEYSQITKNIFIGTNMCCVTHFDKSLIKRGIEADVSLEFEKMDQPFGATYYSWLPTKDHTAPTQKQIKVGVDFITSLVKNKVKVYVHCERGHGRAPTLVAAYLISRGKTTKQAISFIKNKRPSIHLDKCQVNALKKFERDLKLNH